MKKDPFHGAKSKLKQARRHINTLAGLQAETFSQENLEYFAEFEGEMLHTEFGSYRMLHHKVRLKSDFPDDVANYAADALSNLRSSLDLATVECARLGGHARVNDVRFPFLDRPGNVDAIGCTEKLNSRVLEVLQRLKPWPAAKGGNELLFALNRLRNTDIHELLTPVAVNPHSWEINMRSPGLVIDFRQRMPNWNHEKNEGVIFEVDPYSKLDVEVKANFFIALGAVAVFPGAPALPVLHAMADMVEDIIRAFEAAMSQV